MADIDNLPKPKVNLTSVDGNAFMVLGVCNQALREAGWDKEQLAEFSEQAMSGDYNHLLAVACKFCEVS